MNVAARENDNITRKTEKNVKSNCLNYILQDVS